MSAAPHSEHSGQVPWARVDLGPTLPMAVFTSTERWNAERIGALALYCSDGRWGEVFDEFCHRRLLIPRYDRWAVPGGPAWLLPRESGHDFSQTTQEQLDFLVRVHELERIVLVTHYGCAYYAELCHKDADGSCNAEDCHDCRCPTLLYAAEVIDNRDGHRFISDSRF